MASDPVEDMCVQALAHAKRIGGGSHDDDIAAEHINQLVICLRAQRAAAQGHWEDKPDSYTRDINLAHPITTKRFDLYEKAMAMVSARHSKYALIDCINWLLAVQEKLTLIVRKAHAVRRFGRTEDKLALDDMLAEWEQGL